MKHRLFVLLRRVPEQIERQQVTDSASLGPSKVFNEALRVTDDYMGVANVDDDETLAFGKNISEQLNVSEQRNVSLQRTNAEPLGANDSGLLFWTDYCDSTYFTQSYVGQERTFT